MSACDVQTPLMLGPSIADGSFTAAAIKSIHYKRLAVPEVVAGQTAAIALKKVRLPSSVVLPCCLAAFLWLS